jgi:hypothetical protein
MIPYRVTCVYFVVVGLSVLGVFDSEEEMAKLPFTKQQIIDWIYDQQVTVE